MNTRLHTRTKAALLLAIMAVGSGAAFANDARAQTNYGTLYGGGTFFNSSYTDSFICQNRTNYMQAEIQALRSEIATLRSRLEISSGVSGTGAANAYAGTGASNASSVAPSTAAVVSQNAVYVGTGTSMSFSGRGFSSNELVTVRDWNGNIVGSAYADAGGNVGIGSVPVTTGIGIYPYALRGESSGISGSVSVTVRP